MTMKTKTVPLILCGLLTAVSAFVAGGVGRAQSGKEKASQYHAQIWEINPQQGPVCATREIDIRVLPPIESETVRGVHLLPIEYTNMGTKACHLLFDRDLKLNAKEETVLDLDYDSTPAQEFVKPGETAHKLLAWSSIPREAYYPCSSFDGFTIVSMLTVRHLWMQVCGSVMDSQYRAGPYASGEELPKDWMGKDGYLMPPETRDAKFAYNIPLKGAADSNAEGREVRLEALVPQPLLGEKANLRLTFAHPVPEDCPFYLVRMRKADGETTVDFNHCEANNLPGKDTSVLWLEYMGLLPDTTGDVRFDVISRIQTENGPVYAQSNTAQMFVRSNKLPTLPYVLPPLQICEAQSLALAEPVILPQQGNRVARVYQVKNQSASACRLGGVPELQVVTTAWDESEKRQVENKDPLTMCGNCEDPLYAPRPNGWIDLQPGDSAHFLIGYGTAKQYDWAIPADKAVRLEWKDADKSINLPLEDLVQNPADVSSWRAGGYDGDPKNEHWHAPLTSTVQELPPDCNSKQAKKDMKEKGRPFFFEPKDGVAIGISLKETQFALDEDVYPSVWVDNGTDESMTFSYGNGSIDPVLEVWDAYGHLVAEPPDLHPSAPNDETFVETTTATVIDIPIEVAAHSCAAFGTRARAGHGGMFGPGTYIVNIEQRGKDGKPVAVPVAPKTGLTFTVINVPGEKGEPQE